MMMSINILINQLDKLSILQINNLMEVKKLRKWPYLYEKLTLSLVKITLIMNLKIKDSLTLQLVLIKLK